MRLVRVTQLEQFRKYMSGCSYIEEEDIIASLSGEFTGNNKTRIGTAGHAIIEKGFNNLFVDDDNTWIAPIDNEYFARFSADQVNLLLEHRLSLPAAFHELKHGKNYNTRHYTIHVGGTQDIIHGITVHDTKFVFRKPDYSNYTDSCQWRFYLQFLGLDIFYFDLFEFIGYQDDMKLNVALLELKQHKPLNCVRYKNMEQDNQNLVENFVDWVEYRGLTHLLKQKETYYE